jgi:peroxiredoxin
MIYRLLLISFFILATEAVYSQQSAYKINGTIDTALKINTLYFSQTTFYGNTMPKAQKVAISNGKFTISGTIDEPGPAFLSLNESLKPADPADLKQFVLDKGNIDIIIGDQLSKAKITGSKANDDIVRYTEGQAPAMAKINALNEAAQHQQEKKVPVDSIIRMYHEPLKEAGKELAIYQRSFISKNPDAFVSLLLIPEVARASNDFFEAEVMLNKLNAGVKGGPAAKAIIGYINSEKKTSVGAYAPEFSMTDTAGKAIPLSSLKGKYVLLDFWAAWCKPCRDENPNVVKSYNTFKNKGFTVLGVSLDKERRDWLKAIKTDNLTWQHVSDLKFWQNEAAIIYGVTGIPRNFLLDPKGKIIGRDLRGPDLTDKLNEIFLTKK